MVPISVSKDRSKFSSGNVLIKTRDIATVDKLLSLHGRWIDGYPLSCWLMGHEHLETDDYNIEFDLNELASYFSDTKPDKEESKQLNPESTQVTHDEEFEVTKIVRGKQTVTVEDEEFTITKKK